MKSLPKLSFLIILFLLYSSVMLLAKIESIKLLTNAHCSGCKTKIEKALKKVDGVISAKLDLPSKIVEVSYDSEKADIEKLKKAIEKSGYSAELFKEGEEITLPKHKDDDCKEEKHKENKNK